MKPLSWKAKMAEEKKRNKERQREERVKQQKMAALKEEKRRRRVARDQQEAELHRSRIIKVTESKVVSQVAGVGRRSFKFDQVLFPEMPQDTMYTHVAAKLTGQVLRGYNCCLLVYGQTGSGESMSNFLWF